MSKNLLKTCFIGHRHAHKKYLQSALYQAIEQQINQGCKHFIMGTHGSFDIMALDTCRKLRNKYPDIVIEVVLTNLNELFITPAKLDIKYLAYSDVERIVYDIENVYFKNRITKSNEFMVDECTTLICYVDDLKYTSGARRLLKYAQKKKLNIINIFNKSEE